jgi:hypothetical protein
MENMRKKGSGTWDVCHSRWELKRLGIRKTPRQLAEELGEEVPEGKTASRPFWEKYLRGLRAVEDTRRREQCRFQTRLKSLDIIIEALEVEGRDASVFKAEQLRVIGIPDHDIDNADFPALHPDAAEQMAVLGLDPTDELAVHSLNATHCRAVKPSPKKGGLRHEAERYIASKNGKDKWNQRAALDVFLVAAGDITVREIDREVYLRYIEALKRQDNWNAASKAKHQSRLHTFLHSIEEDFDLRFPWLGRRRYMMPNPEGRKVQYTLDQIRTALANANGIARCALMLALNCGWYAGDIAEVQPEHIADGHISKVRAKLKHKATRVKPVWLLWPETEAALMYGLTKRDIEREFQKLRDQHGLPEHKALRKTVAQMIQDGSGEEESVLYRGEARAGTHHRNYIVAYTTPQVARLDAALQKVHEILFGAA